MTEKYNAYFFLFQVEIPWRPFREWYDDTVVAIIRFVLIVASTQCFRNYSRTKTDGNRADTVLIGLVVMEENNMIRMIRSCKNIPVSITRVQTSVWEWCQYCYSNAILITLQTMVKRVVGHVNQVLVLYFRRYVYKSTVTRAPVFWCASHSILHLFLS